MFATMVPDVDEIVPLSLIGAASSAYDRVIGTTVIGISPWGTIIL